MTTKTAKRKTSKKAAAKRLPAKNTKAVKEASAEAAETPERKTISQAAQLAKYKEQYEPYQNATSGSISMDNGDAVATLLRSTHCDVVVRAAEIVRGMDKGTLRTRYENLNPGSRRMNAGNMIRGGVRDKDTKEIDAAGLKVVQEAVKAASKEANATSK